MHKSTLDEAPLLAQLAILLTAAVWLTEHAVIEGALGKVQFLTLFVTGFGGLLTTRSIARWAAGRWAPRERCLLLGDATAYQRLADKLALQGSAGTELVGRVDLDGASNGTSVNDRLREIVREHRVHRIVVAPSNTDSELALNLIREANTLGIKISLLPRFSEALGSSVVFDELPGMTLMAARRFGLSRSSLMLKRAFDLCAVTIGMVVVAPLMAVIGVAVLLDSRGPVLFRQARVGQDGESFQMLKFRTMRDGADEQKAALMALNEGVGMFKIAKDPRITRVGRLLRRTSLDELPQLFNVLKGDMSLVGPRPLVSEEDQRIEGWHRRRLNLLPGMTGHWQVLGGARIPLPEMLAIDYLYVANWSLWTDLKYLLRTVPHILSGRGM